MRSPADLAKDTSHYAARIDDAWLRFRGRRARRRGWSETVLGYTGYGSTGWVRVLARVLLTKEPSVLASSRQPRNLGGPGARGWRSFTSVPVVDAPVRIEIGDQAFAATTDRGGVLDTKIEIALPPGWHTVTLRAGEAAHAEADIAVIDPAARFGIVSDIDDTVMVTALPRPLLAAWHTFVVNEHARTPTPGMAVLYERLAALHPESPVIYLSTGAWNVAPTLTRFLSRNLYPPGPLLLTDWGPTPDRWFRSGPEHKRGNLARLAEEFPDIDWLLVGDDGQHDEMIYGEFAERFGDHLAAVAIRQLTPGEAVLAGGRHRDGAATPPGRWVYGPDGAALAAELRRVGVLPDE